MSIDNILQSEQTYTTNITNTETLKKINLITKGHCKIKDKDYFDSYIDPVDFKNRVIKGGISSITARTINIFIQLVGLMILARILSPEDFGLFAMGTAIINIFLIFQDVGLTDATIQADKLTHSSVSTVFWINFLIGIIIAIFIIVISPLAVIFFKRPELRLIMVISSIEFVLYGASVQHIALLKRRLLFNRVAVIQTSSYISGTLISIIAAVLGMRYWALVIRGLVSALITFFLTWLICKWRPGPAKRSSEVKKLVRFGLNSAIYYIINYSANNIDKIITGKLFKADLLGYYSRAYLLAATPSGYLSQSLFHLAVSTLSKLREDKEKFKQYYFNSLSLLSFIGMPISALMVVLNEELVYVLLGPQWRPAKEYFLILGLSAGINIIYQTSSWLHVSLARSDRWLKWGIISSSILTANFVLGSLIGLKGISWAYTLSIIAFTVPAIIYAGKPISISFPLIKDAIFKNTLAALISGVGLWLIKINYLNNLKLPIRLVISIFIFCIFYIITYVCFYKSLKQIVGFYMQMRSAIFNK